MEKWVSTYSTNLGWDRLRPYVSWWYPQCPKQAHNITVNRFCSYKKHSQVWKYTIVAHCFPNTWEALCSIPRTTKTNKRMNKWIYKYIKIKRINKSLKFFATREHFLSEKFLHYPGCGIVFFSREMLLASCLYKSNFHMTYNEVSCVLWGHFKPRTHSTHTLYIQHVQN